jgi:hypothetical protein
VGSTAKNGAVYPIGGPADFIGIAGCAEGLGKIEEFPRILRIAFKAGHHPIVHWIDGIYWTGGSK